ncbi:chaplin [Streptomyces sp. NBC_00386]|uniref:chaplin n=1 Tax=Streptomyces sp. NBC_00386 TaxID=2975734 RepID=UPI002E1CFBDB
MRQVTRKGLMTVVAAGGVLAVTGVSAHADSGAIGSASDSPGVLSGNTVQAPVHVPVNVCGNTVNVVGLLNPAMGNTCVNHGGRGASSEGRGGHGGQGGHAGRETRSGGGSRAVGSAAHSPGVGSGNHVQAPVDVPVNVCGNSVNVVGIGNAAAGDSCANGASTGGHQTHHPGRPGRPGHPGQPGQPSHPGHPGHDGHCEHPGHAGHPGEPGHPGHPGHPGTPGHPSHPDHPGNPGTPGHPGTSTPGGGKHRAGAVQAGRPGSEAAVRAPGTDGAPQLAHTGSELPIGAAVPAGAAALLAGAVLYRRARAAA